MVDGPEGETAVDKALRKEAVKAILNGAAIFYPDKQSRRDKLFLLMVRLQECTCLGWILLLNCFYMDKLLFFCCFSQQNITEENQPESVKLTFESLCSYFRYETPPFKLVLPVLSCKLYNLISCSHIVSHSPLFAVIMTRKVSLCCPLKELRLTLTSHLSWPSWTHCSLWPLERHVDRCQPHLFNAAHIQSPANSWHMFRCLHCALTSVSWHLVL